MKDIIEIIKFAFDICLKENKELSYIEFEALFGSLLRDQYLNENNEKNREDFIHYFDTHHFYKERYVDYLDKKTGKRPIDLKFEDRGRGMTYYPLYN